MRNGSSYLSCRLMSGYWWLAVNVASTLVAVFGVDRLGRRFLWIEAGIQMAVTHVLVAILMAVYLKADNMSWPTALPSASSSSCEIHLLHVHCVLPLRCIRIQILCELMRPCFLALHLPHDVLQLCLPFVPMHIGI